MKIWVNILVLTIFIGSNTRLLASDVLVDWLSKDESLTYAAAEEFFSNENLPTEKAIVLYEIEIVFGDEYVTRTVRQVSYFPTYNDTHTAGNESIYWDQEIESLTIREAQIVYSNGRAPRRLDASNIRVRDSDSYNTFTDQKEVVLPYSGLENKSLSILEYELKFSVSDLESRWSTVLYPVLFEPVNTFKLKVVENKQTPLTYSNNAKDIVECTVDEHELLCQGKNLASTKSDANIVWRDVLPQIVISETQSWDDVISTSIEAFDKSENEDSSVSKILKTIIHDEMSQGEKIAAIHKFVSRGIRYISMSELGHRITPHTSASVIENRFGDCKDKSALLKGLLSLIGIEAHPVLVATQRTNLKNISVPSGGYFDHVVVCFNSEERFYCLDPTDTSTDTKSISSWIQGTASLTLQPGSKPSHIPQSGYKWRLDISTSLVFDDKATVTEMQERTYRGEYASGMRANYSSKSEEERTEFATERFRNVVSALGEPKFEFVGMEDMEHDVVIRSKTDYPPFLDPDEPLNYIEYDSWLKQEISDLEILTKYHDTRIQGVEVQSTRSFDFGGIWRVTWHPSNLRIKGRFGEMTRTVLQAEGDKVEIVTKIQIISKIVKKEDIKEFNDFLKLLKLESALNFDGVVL